MRQSEVITTIEWDKNPKARYKTLEQYVESGSIFGIKKISTEDTKQA